LNTLGVILSQVPKAIIRESIKGFIRFNKEDDFAPQTDIFDDILSMTCFLMKLTLQRPISLIWLKMAERSEAKSAKQSFASNYFKYFCK